MAYTFKLNQKDDAKMIRRKVFMDEMGFRIEFETKDENPDMNHIVMYVDDNPVGYVRVFPITLEGKLVTVPDGWVFGRLAVLKDHRNKGLGTALVKSAEDFARERGGKEMFINVQKPLEGYFSEMGYEAFGPEKFDEHLLHQWMKKEL